MVVKKDSLNTQEVFLQKLCMETIEILKINEDEICELMIPEPVYTFIDQLPLNKGDMLEGVLINRKTRKCQLILNQKWICKNESSTSTILDSFKQDNTIQGAKEFFRRNEEILDKIKNRDILYKHIIRIINSNKNIFKMPEELNLDRDDQNNYKMIDDFLFLNIDFDCEYDQLWLFDFGLFKIRKLVTSHENLPTPLNLVTSIKEVLEIKYEVKKNDKSALTDPIRLSSLSSISSNISLSQSFINFASQYHDETIDIKKSKTNIECIFDNIIKPKQEIWLEDKRTTELLQSSMLISKISKDFYNLQTTIFLLDRDTYISLFCCIILGRVLYSLPTEDFLIKLNKSLIIINLEQGTLDFSFVDNEIASQILQYIFQEVLYKPSIKGNQINSVCPLQKNSNNYLIMSSNFLYIHAEKHLLRHYVVD